MNDNFRKAIASLCLSVENIIDSLEREKDMRMIENRELVREALEYLQMAKLDAENAAFDLKYSRSGEM